MGREGQNAAVCCPTPPVKIPNVQHSRGPEQNGAAVQPPHQAHSVPSGVPHRATAQSRGRTTSNSQGGSCKHTISEPAPGKSHRSGAHHQATGAGMLTSQQRAVSADRPERQRTGKSGKGKGKAVCSGESAYVTAAAQPVQHHCEEPQPTPGCCTPPPVNKARSPPQGEGKLQQWAGPSYCSPAPTELPMPSAAFLSPRLGSSPEPSPAASSAASAAATADLKRRLALAGFA